MTTQPYGEWERERSCSRKRRYDNKIAANTAVLTVWAAGRWARAYHCPHCTSWHITSRREELPRG